MRSKGSADGYVADVWGVAFAGDSMVATSAVNGGVNVLRMVNHPSSLTTAGWAGIGTTRPDVPLHVLGNLEHLPGSVRADAHTPGGPDDKLVLGGGSQRCSDRVGPYESSFVGGTRTLPHGDGVAPAGGGAVADLSSTSWPTLLSGNVSGNGSQRTVTDTGASESKKFYKVEIVKP